jgi:predicted nucleic acid-binding protein
VVDMLLDTNILVDMLRGYQPAVEWKNEQGDAIMGISSIVRLEVVQGTQNKIALNRAIKFLKQFQVINLTLKDQDWALLQLVRFNLSHNIDLTDALIAAPAYRLQKALFTRNSKYFVPMIPTLIHQPY